MRRWHLAAAIAALAVIAAACGSKPVTSPGAGGGGRDPNSLILRMSTAGGFVPQEYALKQFPEFSLMGDGRVFTLGAQIEIYPPPAMLPVLMRTVTAQGIAKIVEEAKAAGLDGPDKEYRYDLVADAGTTVFTYVDDDGKTHTISAYALGFEADGASDPPGQTAQEKEARAKLAKLREKLGDLTSWMPAGSVGEDKPVDPTALRIFARAYTTNPDEPSQTAKDWPLSSKLAEFGQTFGDQYRCGTVEGADVDKLLPDLKQSNTRTPWTSDGKQYELIVRPLLPDETGCPAS